MSWAPDADDVSDSETTGDHSDRASTTFGPADGAADNGAGLLAPWKDDETLCVTQLASLKGASVDCAESMRQQLEEKLKNIRNDIRMAKILPLRLKALQRSEGACERKLYAAK